MAQTGYCGVLGLQAGQAREPLGGTLPIGGGETPYPGGSGSPYPWGRGGECLAQEGRLTQVGGGRLAQEGRLPCKGSPCQLAHLPGSDGPASAAPAPLLAWPGPLHPPLPFKEPPKTPPKTLTHPRLRKEKLLSANLVSQARPSTWELEATMGQSLKGHPAPPGIPCSPARFALIFLCIPPWRLVARRSRLSHAAPMEVPRRPVGQQGFQ